MNRELDFIRAHPEFRRKMAHSQAFSRIKRDSLVEIDGENLYIVKGDTLGDEEELYIESLVRGAAGQGELNRTVYEELDEVERKLVTRAFRK